MDYSARPGAAPSSLGGLHALWPWRLVRREIIRGVHGIPAPDFVGGSAVHWNLHRL